VVLNRGFLAVFVGTAVGCLVLLATSAVRWQENSSKLLATIAILIDGAKS
jgi:uncharacterized membrane protein